MDEAKTRLLAALPHLRFAMAEAAKNGRAQVGILCLKPDRTGQIVAQFDAPDFFNDLAEVLGAPPQSEDDNIEAVAERIAQGVRRGVAAGLDAPPKGEDKP